MHGFDLRLPSGDRNVCTATLPAAGAMGLPVVVYCHGWKSHRRDWSLWPRLLETLVPAGVAGVAIDFYGCGETAGDYRGMTYGRWKDNLLGLAEFLGSQPWADGSRIGLVAVSSGTTAALRFAAESTSAAFVVSIATALSPFIGGPMNPARVLAENLQTLAAGGTARCLDTDFTADFFVDVLAHSAARAIPEIRCPVFFLQGAADNASRRADAFWGHLTRQARGLPSTYVELAGGDHGLTNVPDAAHAALRDWITSTFPMRRQGLEAPSA